MTTTFTYSQLSKDAKFRAYCEFDNSEYTLGYCGDEVFDEIYDKVAKELPAVDKEFGISYDLDSSDTIVYELDDKFAYDDVIECAERICSEANSFYTERCSQLGWEVWMDVNYPNAQYNEMGELVSLGDKA